MNDPANLTSVLYERADAKLTAKIAAAVDPLWEDFKSHQIGTDGHVVLNGKECWCGQYYKDFKAAMFLAMQRAARDHEVHGFLKTVESLADQIGEVRQIAEQAEHYAMQ